MFLANDEDTDNLAFMTSLLPMIRGWINPAKIKFRKDLLDLIKKDDETENL